MTARRRRGLVMLSLAIASGGLAASEVRSRTDAVERRVGPLVPVVTVRERIAPGTRLTAKRIAAALTTRGVPAGYAPADALAEPSAAEGLRTAGALEPGSYLTASALDTRAGGAASDGGTGGRGSALRKGERALDLMVAGSDGIAAAPGARVDVVITSERRTALALEDVELLAMRPAAATGEGGGGAPAQPPSGAGAAGTAVATLRVTLREAVYLAAAQNFAREIRLLARTPGDDRRGGALEVGAGSL